jgi:hypothetical protein
MPIFFVVHAVIDRLQSSDHSDQVMRTCERNQQWRELVFLQTHYDEYDNAALTMMAHPVDAWDHREFKEILQKASSPSLFGDYRARRLTSSAGRQHRRPVQGDPVLSGGASARDQGPPDRHRIQG